MVPESQCRGRAFEPHAARPSSSYRPADWRAWAFVVCSSACRGEAVDFAELAASSDILPGPSVQIIDHLDDTLVPGSARCNIEVEGLGPLDTEAQYLPRVVQCENGRAGPQALRAQAIAARSVAYHAMQNVGSICDGQGCQVASCRKRPSQAVQEAVWATRGIYISHSDRLTYGFYVAGDPDSEGPSCRGQSVNATERFVTYNRGLKAHAVQQTVLGSLHEPDSPRFGENRGCMSQWGARCLESTLERDARGILEHYYGTDIELRKADLQSCPP